MPRKPAIPGVDRRQQLLEAAFAIFAEQGYEAATTKEITDRAGVNQGLIYFYFESKADIFFATFEHHAQLVLTQLEAIFEQEYDEDPATDLIRIIKQIITVLDTPIAINLLRITHQIASSHIPESPINGQEKWKTVSTLWRPLSQRLCAYLAAQVAAGRLRPVKTDLAASLMTRTLISSIIGRLPGRLARTLPSAQEQAEMIASLFCYGLLPRNE